jgi:hypothetical protein
MNSHRKSRLLTFAASLVLALCVPIAQEPVNLISGNRVPAIAQESVDLISGDKVPAIAQESVDLLSGERVSEESTDLISTDQTASAPAPQKATPADDDGWPSPTTDLLF